MHKKGKFVLDHDLIQNAWEEFRDVIFAETFSNICIFILFSVEGVKYVPKKKDQSSTDADLNFVLDKITRTRHLGPLPKPTTYLAVDGSDTTKEQRTTFHQLVRKYFGPILESQTLSGTLYLHLLGDSRFSFSKTNFVPLPPKNQVVPQQPEVEKEVLVVDKQHPSVVESKQEEPQMEVPSTAQLVPTDVLTVIYWYLDGKDLVNCTQVCKQWRNAATETVYKNALLVQPNPQDWKLLGESYYKLFQKQMLTRMNWFRRGFYKVTSCDVQGVQAILVMDAPDAVRLVCTTNRAVIEILKSDILEHKIPAQGQLVKVDERTVLSVLKDKQTLIDVVTGECKQLNLMGVLPARYLNVFRGRYLVSFSYENNITRVFDLHHDVTVTEAPGLGIFNPTTDELLTFRASNTKSTDTIMTTYDLTTGKQKGSTTLPFVYFPYCWPEVFHGYFMLGFSVHRLQDMQRVLNLKDEFVVAKDKLVVRRTSSNDTRDQLTVYSLPELKELGSMSLEKKHKFKTDGNKLVILAAGKWNVINLNKIIPRPESLPCGTVWTLLPDVKGLLVPCNTIDTGFRYQWWWQSNPISTFDLNESVLVAPVSQYPTEKVMVWDFTFRNHESLLRKKEPNNNKKKKKHTKQPSSNVVWDTK